MGTTYTLIKPKAGNRLNSNGILGNPINNWLQSHMDMGMESEVVEGEVEKARW